MDLLDSDIFVLDLRFPNDPRTPANKRLLESLQMPRATTIYNVLEICGVLSFNLSTTALLTLYAEFSRRYTLSVLFPPESELNDLAAMIAGIFEHISQKMTYGDAQILWVAEQHPEVERIITWNVKDFVSRTHLSVMTPEERIGASQPEA